MKIIEITVICRQKDVDAVINTMLNTGWQKDSNLLEILNNGDIKISFWR